ncbi:hypothetical protein GGX14DRAFT_391679 [Mycena pura]|uniref:Uncharacterized protein n=1 Tax=Mycena pura TaxID=153505 RepID=A0AAD6YGL7_9AGAR|nr:hypothetical protein GGX14DRAFT_391679 [Mycena pura]
MMPVVKTKLDLRAYRTQAAAYIGGRARTRQIRPEPCVLRALSACGASQRGVIAAHARGRKKGRVARAVAALRTAWATLGRPARPRCSLPVHCGRRRRRRGKTAASSLALRFVHAKRPRHRRKCIRLAVRRVGNPRVACWLAARYEGRRGGAEGHWVIHARRGAAGVAAAHHGAPVLVRLRARVAAPLLGAAFGCPHWRGGRRGDHSADVPRGVAGLCARRLLWPAILRAQDVRRSTAALCCADIHEKNARPVIRFERQLPTVAPAPQWSPPAAVASADVCGGGTGRERQTLASTRMGAVGVPPLAGAGLWAVRPAEHVGRQAQGGAPFSPRAGRAAAARAGRIGQVYNWASSAVGGDHAGAVHFVSFTIISSEPQCNARLVAQDNFVGVHADYGGALVVSHPPASSLLHHPVTTAQLSSRTKWSKPGNPVSYLLAAFSPPGNLSDSKNTIPNIARLFPLLATSAPTHGRSAAPHRPQPRHPVRVRTKRKSRAGATFYHELEIACIKALSSEEDSSLREARKEHLLVPRAAVDGCRLSAEYFSGIRVQVNFRGLVDTVALYNAAAGYRKHHHHHVALTSGLPNSASVIAALHDEARTVLVAHGGGQSKPVLHRLARERTRWWARCPPARRTAQHDARRHHGRPALRSLREAAVTRMPVTTDDRALPAFLAWDPHLTWYTYSNTGSIALHRRREQFATGKPQS